jgi:hypothetical protein
VIDMHATQRTRATQFRTIRLDKADGVNFQRKSFKRRQQYQRYRSAERFARTHTG